MYRYNFLNDNELLDGEITAVYFEAHDLTVNILNEWIFDYPNELEMRSLYNDLIRQKTNAIG